MGNLQPLAAPSQGVAKASKTSTGPAPQATKFSALAEDKGFQASMEGLGLANGDMAMAVDSNPATLHGGAVEELAKCQEAHALVSSKFGSDSTMAVALQAQVEALQKQQSPLKVTKNMVTLNSHVLRLQKDMERHTTELSKYKSGVEASIAEHQAAIAGPHASLEPETKACEAALKADQTSLDKLRAEIDALNTARTPVGQLPAPVAPVVAAPALQRDAVQQFMATLAGAGMLAPAVLQDQQGTLQQLQQLLQQQAQHAQQQTQQSPASGPVVQSTTSASSVSNTPQVTSPHPESVGPLPKVQKTGDGEDL